MVAAFPAAFQRESRLTHCSGHGFPNPALSGTIPPMWAEPLQQIRRTRVRQGKRELIYFAGCDYLRLASDPRVIRAVEKTLRECGLNVAASRKTTGNHRLYEQLEKDTARFFAAEQALLVSNGYLANLVAAQSLAGEISEALIDERAHSSLQDAARLLAAKVRSFAHCSPLALDKELKEIKGSSRVAILTDGMFAHDGSIAPLADYRRLAPSALLWVDDSHAAGIVGPNGRGTIESTGVGRQNVLQTVTFSKAFGVYGGAVLASRKLCKQALNRSGLAVGNTPLPLPLAGGVIEALKIARNSAARTRLWKNVRRFHQAMGQPVPDNFSPIIPVLPTSMKKASELRHRLLKAGIFPPHIRYPGGPEAGYFRFAISSEHSNEEVTLLARCLRGD